MEYTVHQLAQAAGVSVRTLHYYDEVGLLHPAFVKENGYRCYTEKDTLRLQQILFYRELGFPLEEIKNILNNSQFAIPQALQDHKQLLVAKKKRLDELLATIDITLKSVKGGDTMSTNDLYQGFSDEELKKLQEETKVRWGHTDAYKQSVERTKHWTKADFDKVKKGGEELTSAIAKVKEKGIESSEVQHLIAKHYQSIQQFYECPLEMYKNLGKMYVNDPRFTAYYEKFAPGLAIFMKDAIAYYCDQHR